MAATVSRAAGLLHLTQPAVSLQLKGLEESTGLQLFNRTPGGFTLTEAGAALLPEGLAATAAARGARVLPMTRPTVAEVHLIWRAGALTGLGEHFRDVATSYRDRL